MKTTQASVIDTTGQQGLGKDRGGSDNVARMVYAFGIAIILFGVTALIILRMRSKLPGVASEAAVSAKSFADSTQQSINDELRWLDQSLNLSPEQEAEVRPVVEDEIQERIALLEAPSISTSEQEAQLVHLRNQALEKIRPVLTDRQRVVLQGLEHTESGQGAPRPVD